MNPVPLFKHFMFKLFFDRGLVYVRYGLCDCVVNIIVTVANICRRAIRNQGKLESNIFSLHAVLDLKI